MTTQVYNTSLISYKDKLPTVLSVQLSANVCVLQLYVTIFKQFLPLKPPYHPQLH